MPRAIGPWAKAAAPATAATSFFFASFAIEYLFGACQMGVAEQLKVIMRKARKRNPPFANQAKASRANAV